ncbi:outer membrane beta-barrel protein [Chitinophaga sp. Hz27]|uniref:outer membrane beta-barrel protein n=1 Tax=Chitinophaga sp. Hz27 TaxID=3347169 RepID=UPI0035D9DDAF
MKTITLTLAVLCSSYFAQAQFHVGIKAGAGGSYHSKNNTPNIDAHNGHDNYFVGSKASYYAGISADWQLSKHFSVQPSLVYSAKGGSTKERIWNTGVTYNTSTQSGEDRLNYLELPVNLIFRQQLGKGHSFIGAGLYEARYLNGSKDGKFQIRELPKMKEQPPMDASAEFVGPLGTLYPGKQADAKHWDTGANFTAGYEFPGGLQLALNYSLGFQETFYGKNRAYSVSVAYYLHKK